MTHIPTFLAGRLAAGFWPHRRVCGYLQGSLCPPAFRRLLRGSGRQQRRGSASGVPRFTALDLRSTIEVGCLRTGSSLLGGPPALAYARTTTWRMVGPPDRREPENVRVQGQRQGPPCAVKAVKGPRRTIAWRFVRRRRCAVWPMRRHPDRAQNWCAQVFYGRWPGRETISALGEAHLLLLGQTLTSCRPPAPPLSPRPEA